MQPQQYLVVRTGAAGGSARSTERAFDRYERSFPRPTFRSPEDEASWRRTPSASRHLADHLDEAPAIVVFLLPIIPWTPTDDEGPMDIGRLYASVYPAVQNFMVAARALGIGTALTTVIRIHTTSARAARRPGALRGGRASCRWAARSEASAWPAASRSRPSPTGTRSATSAADL